MMCNEARSLLSWYLDGALTGRQMQALGNHLDGCRECRSQYLLLQQTQKLVSALPRRQAPADLALKLRVAISREAALARRPRWEGFRERMQAAANAFMVPATAGLLSAILIFGMLVGLFTIPMPAADAANDVPTMLYTPPELRTAPYAIGVGSISSDSLVVEAYVDAEGRVYDSRIVEGHPDAEQETALKNALIFTVFRPAMSFGRPIPATKLLSFSKINVKG